MPAQSTSPVAGGAWNTLHAGDNLDVLPALAPGSVDVVYTDPPYNTGNDFAYADRFRDGSHADPYAGRHAAWTAMMRPRLEAVREVLAPHGAVFVSIDDNEAAHLRLLMDEVFGEANFLAQIVVNLNPKGRQLGRGFATSHEYVLAYARHLPPCAVDGSTHGIGRRGRLPAQHGGRSALPLPPAAQHQQEVQPAHRADPALRAARRPGRPAASPPPSSPAARR